MKEKAKKKVRWILGIICCISLAGNMVCFCYINTLNSELKALEEEITPTVKLHGGRFLTQQKISVQNTIIEAQKNSCVYEMDEDFACISYEPITEGKEIVELKYKLKENYISLNEFSFSEKKGDCLNLSLNEEGEYLIHANYNGVDKYISFQLKKK